MSVTELLLELGRRDISLELQGAELSVKGARDALDADLLAELRTHKSALLVRLGHVERSSIPQADRTQPIPLSAAQERMWFLKRLEVELGRFNVPIAAHVRGHIDPEALSRSFDRLVARHELLRTRYELIDGRPVQFFVEPFSPLVRTSLPAHDEETRSKAIKELISSPGDENDRVMTVRLLEFEDDDYVLAMTLRDVAFDNWSRGVLVSELATLYQAEVDGRSVELPPMRIQYADWCAWQRSWLAGPEAQSQLQWWVDTLADLPFDGGIPSDHPRPQARSMRARLHSVTLSPAVSQSLRSWAIAHGATLYTALLCAFAVVATRRSGYEGLVIGSPVANREHPEVANMLGYLANNLVLHLRPDQAQKPEALLRAIREQLQAALKRQAVPIEKVAEALGRPRRADSTALFQILVVLNATGSAPSLGGATLEALVGDELVSRFDMELALEDSGSQISGWLKYDAELYDSGTIAALSEDLALVAAQLPTAASLEALSTPAVAALPPPHRSEPQVLSDSSVSMVVAKEEGPRPLRGSTEHTLAGIYSKVLEVPVNSTEHNFFGLGGNSLATVRLALELRKAFSVEVPLHVILEHSGIGELGAWIDERIHANDAPAATDPLMIMLVHNPGGRPVFALPPMIGSSACYADLDWPSDISVWGSEIPGLFQEYEGKVDVGTLISRWADAIRQIQPSGPYTLIGWSLGAMLALELCAELEGRGTVVDRVCLIDGGPLPGEGASRWQFWAKSPGRPRDVIRIWGRVSRPSDDELRRWLSWCGISLPSNTSGISVPKLEVWRALAGRMKRTLFCSARNAFAATRYRPRRCFAPVHLIRAAEHRDQVDPLVARVRAATIGDVDVQYADGNHMTIMLDPQHRKALSRKIEDILNLRNLRCEALNIG